MAIGTTLKGTVNLLKHSAIHRQQFIISFKTYLTSLFAGLLIYILLKHTCYHSRSTFLSFKTVLYESW